MDFEVFHSSDIGSDYPDWHTMNYSPGEYVPPVGVGWYWWSCSPGCLPAEGPSGPFETEDEAIEDAESALNLD